MIETIDGRSQVRLAAGTSMTVDLDLALAVAVVLDTEALSQSDFERDGRLGYEAIQGLVADRMNDRRADDAVVWNPSPARSGRRSSGMAFDVDDYSGSTVLPLWFAECEIDSAPVLDAATEALDVFYGDRPHEVEVRDGRLVSGPVSVELGPGRFKVFDFCAGTLTVSTVVRPRDEEIVAADIRTAVERVSSCLGCIYLAVLNEAMGELREALDHHSAPHGPIPRDAHAWVDSNGSYVKVRWAHRIYRITVDPGTDASTCCDLIDDFLVAMPLGLQEPITMVGGVYVPGTGSSACCCDDPAKERSLTAMIDLKNAYFVAVMEIDRVLFDEVASFSVSTRSLDSRSVGGQSRPMAQLAERVRVFQLVEAGIRVHLPPLEQVLWTRIDDVWGKAEMDTNIASKIESLHLLFEQRFREASARQQERLNVGVGVFTIVSLIGVAIAVYDFVFRDADRDLTIQLRLNATLLTVVTSVITLAVVFVLLRSRSTGPAPGLTPFAEDFPEVEAGPPAAADTP